MDKDDPLYGYFNNQENWNKVLEVALWRFYPEHYESYERYRDAEDLTQETFYRALVKNKLLKGNNFNGWLYRIMEHIRLNEIRDFNRKKNFFERADITPETENYYYEISDYEACDLLQHNYNSLNDTEKKCIVLHTIEGLKYKEIAKRLKIPAGTVGSHINRAKKIFKGTARNREKRVSILVEANKSLPKISKSKKRKNAYSFN